MLLLPLGPEDREVRRWPWVTITIVTLNVLVFAVAGPADRSAGDPLGVFAQWGFDDAGQRAAARLSELRPRARAER